MSPSDLERNDVAGAVALRRRRIEAGTWTPESAHAILMLQDDTSDLIAAIQADDAEHA